MTTLLRKIVPSTMFLLVAVTSSVAQTSPDATKSSGKSDKSEPISLSRSYREGETLAYHMKATNKGRSETKRYEADVNCVVKKDPVGIFAEECAWSNLMVNGQPTVLSPAAQSFRQTVSLDSKSTPAVPDLSQVIPLVGPITDLLTFYSDLWLANRTNQLHRSGDHFYFEHGTPNSWADGSYVLLGQDSIDFDMSLADQTQGTNIVVVRHVSPAKSQIKLSADWMKMPVVGDTPNNWVEVEKTSEGAFSAEVGKETFDVRLTVSQSGKIQSATLDNPVEVLQRDCNDAELTKCGTPVRYQIMRRIELTTLR